jgi:molecular chaperone DnaJ
VVYRQQSMFWMIEHRGTCKSCWWNWKIFDKICNTCSGNKRIKQTVSLDVDVPSGIDAEMVIKIEWEWNHWIKWENGDLYIRFQLNTIEKWLHRKWVHLYYDLEIDVIEAILWTSKEINIPIIWKRNISIVAGTQFGTVIKIAWDGVKYIDKDKKWDLFININIKIPKKLSETERNCFEKIAAENKLNVHNKKWILEKIFW